MHPPSIVPYVANYKGSSTVHLNKADGKKQIGISISLAITFTTVKIHNK